MSELGLRSEFAAAHGAGIEPSGFGRGDPGVVAGAFAAVVAETSSWAPAVS